MKNKVFISHAGEDHTKARVVANALAEEDLIPIIDRNSLEPGDSFITFMEKGIKECDYFILLWTKLAQQKKWVQIEWESALSREMQDNRKFLIIGRLENYPPPMLLRSRLYIDLFPNIKHGMIKFIELVKKDQEAQDLTGRQVLPAKVNLQEDDTDLTIYITSELFGVTIPIKTPLDLPSGVKLTQLVNDLALPTQVAYKDKLGFRLNYRFVTKDGAVVEMSNPFSRYGIDDGDVLWLEVKMVPFHQVEPIEGELQSAIFRGAGDDANIKAKVFTTQQLNLALKQAGLISPE